MAVPLSTTIWDEPMDPYDNVDYVIDFTAALDGDNIASYTVNATADSQLLGLTVGTGSDYGPKQLSSNTLRVWLSIDSSKQAASVFDGTGVILPLEVSVTTDAYPPRRKQRTVAVRVVQR